MCSRTRGVNRDELRTDVARDKQLVCRTGFLVEATARFVRYREVLSEPVERHALYVLSPAARCDRARRKDR